MNIPRRMIRLPPQQLGRLIISLLLGGLLLTVLVLEGGQNRSKDRWQQPDQDLADVKADLDTPELLPSTLAPNFRNPDRWEGHDANMQLRLVRQCLMGGDSTQQCLNLSLRKWRENPGSFVGFLEALRYHERQLGHGGDIGPLLDQLSRMMTDARDATETYQLWLAIHRHRSDFVSHRLSRSARRLQPYYLGLLLQADQTARQGIRTGSVALYEAANVSFLDAMLEKMWKNESITIETFNHTQDLKALAKLYLQLGWWPEAERILFRLAEQEPSDRSIVSLMEQLRLRQTQAQAG